MKIKNTATMLAFVLLLVAAPNAIRVNADIEDMVPMWGVEEGITLVYELTHLLVDGSTSMNMTVWDEYEQQDRDIGVLREGNLIFVEVEQLPQEGDEDPDVRTWMHGTETWEGWEHHWHPQLPQNWTGTGDGPYMFAPVGMIPEDPAHWADIETMWNEAPGFSAVYSSGTFDLSGSNTTANVTDLFLSFDTDNGVLLDYNYETPNGGPDGVAMEMTMEFKYFRDESQWDLGFGIAEGDMAGWEVDQMQYNGTDHIPFDMNNESEGDYLYEGDLMVIGFWELWDPVADPDGHPHWNGSVMTPTFDQSVEFDFDTGDGPQLFYPVMPLGNDAFFGNITDEFESCPGTTVTQTTSLLTITISTTDVSESASWDLVTGLMQSWSYDGPGPEDLPVIGASSFVYHLPGADTHEIVVPEDISIRYIADNVQNGTRDYLDFGADEGEEPFMLYEGDIFSVWMYMETTEDGEELRWGGHTSSGYEMNDNSMDGMPPGLEFYYDGPPGFMLIIPLGDAAWWSAIETTFTALGYTVTNTADQIGYAAVGDDFDLEVLWSKDDGILDYYCVEGIDPDTGNVMQWEMHRGTTVNPDTLNWQWGIAVDDTWAYEFTDIQTADGDYFTWSESEAHVTVGDQMDVHVTALADLSVLEEGPSVTANLGAAGITEHDNEVGLQEPGFEFVYFDEDDEDMPPFLYMAIPVGDMDYWSLLATMYGEAGYTVTNDAVNFTVHVNMEGDYFVTVTWDKTTGILQLWDVLLDTGDGDMRIRAVLVGGSSTDTSTDSTTTEDTGGDDDGGLIPGFTIMLTLPLMLAVAVVVRRKRD